MTHKNTIFYTFPTKFTPLKAQKAPRKLKNCIFGLTSNSSSFFYPLPLPFWGYVSNFIMSRDPVIIEARLDKISFSKPMLFQSNQGKTLSGYKKGYRKFFL